MTDFVLIYSVSSIKARAILKPAKKALSDSDVAISMTALATSILSFAFSDSLKKAASLFFCCCYIMIPVVKQYFN